MVVEVALLAYNRSHYKYYVLRRLLWGLRQTAVFFPCRIKKAFVKNLTRLTPVFRQFNLKAKNVWLDKSVTELFELLKDMLSEGNMLSNRNYEVKKILFLMGLK